uniref:(northern house mosquito) hypothetical protein n=1 Tax=Culex pipiens TaxID=7175 RepID=A0A8D8MXS3_CULPI
MTMRPFALSHQHYTHSFSPVTTNFPAAQPFHTEHYLYLLWGVFTCSSNAPSSTQLNYISCVSSSENNFKSTRLKRQSFSTFHFRLPADSSNGDFGNSTVHVPRASWKNLGERSSFGFVAGIDDEFLHHFCVIQQ